MHLNEPSYFETLLFLVAPPRVQPLLSLSKSTVQKAPTAKK